MISEIASEPKLHAETHIIGSLRKEIGVANGIQVSMVSPSVIDTGLADKVSDAEGRKAATELHKDGISPQAVGDAVAYALDQPANVTVNGVVLHPTKKGW